jgi:hypothetical protein
MWTTRLKRVTKAGATGLSPVQPKKLATIYSFKYSMLQTHSKNHGFISDAAPHSPHMCV